MQKGKERMAIQRADEGDLHETILIILCSWRVVLVTTLTVILFVWSFIQTEQRTSYQAVASVRIFDDAVCARLSLVDPTLCTDGLMPELERAASNITSPVFLRILSEGFTFEEGAQSSPLDTDLDFEAWLRNVVSLNYEDGIIYISALTERSDFSVFVANKVAEAFVEFLDDVYHAYLVRRQEFLSSELEFFPAYSVIDNLGAALIELERLSIQSEIGLISHAQSSLGAIADIQSSSQPPIAIYSLNQNLMLGFGGVLGVLLGVLVSLIRAYWRGALYGIDAIRGSLPVSFVVPMASGRKDLFYQDIRVAAGDPEVGLISICGNVDKDRLREVSLGLLQDFRKHHKDTIFIDAAGLFSHQNDKNDNLNARVGSVEAFGVDVLSIQATDLPNLVAELSGDGRLLLVVTPGADVDLATVSKTFRSSVARIVIFRRFCIFRSVLERLKLAGLVGDGRSVLAIMD